MIDDVSLIEKRNEIKEQLSAIDLDDSLIGIRVGLGRSIQKLLHLANPPPYWLGVTLITLIPVIISLLISLLLKENHSLRQDFVKVEIFFIFMTPLFSFVFQKYFKNVFTFWTEYLLDSIRFVDDLENFQVWLDNFLNTKNSFVTGLATALITLPVYAYLIATGSRYFGIGPTVFIMILMFFVGIGLYILFHFMILPQRISNYKFNIFRTDPNSTLFINRLSSVLSNFVYLVALLLATGVFLSSIMSSRSLLIFEVVLGWIPISAIFALNQYALRKIITLSKLDKLSDLQSKIEYLEGQNDIPSKEILENIRGILAYHDHIKATRSSALDVRATLNFLNSLLLPLIAFFLGNLDSITSLIFK